jgi:hypothetical protein
MQAGRASPLKEKDVGSCRSITLFIYPISILHPICKIPTADYRFSEWNLVFILP